MQDHGARTIAKKNIYAEHFLAPVPDAPQLTWHVYGVLR